MSETTNASERPNSMSLNQLQIQNLQAIVGEQGADLDALRKQADALEAMMGFQKDQLKIRKARLEDWKSKYYAVADAITRESTGVDDLCRQARAIRAERDRYKEMAHESVGEIGSALVNAEDQRNAALAREEELAKALEEAKAALARLRSKVSRELCQIDEEELDEVDATAHKVLEAHRLAKGK